MLNLCHPYASHGIGDIQALELDYGLQRSSVS